MTAAPSGWDEVAVRAARGHVLQSSAWGTIREAQGWRAEYVRFGDRQPVALVLWRTVLGQAMAYVPRGPVLATGDPSGGLAAALVALAALARERGALFLKVDPEVAPEVAAPAFAAAGFRRAPDVQPVLATLELDLALSEDALLAGCEKDTRWSIRQEAKRGVSIRVARGDADLRSFHVLYAGTGARAGFITRTWAYYRLVWSTLIEAGLATLRFAEVDGQAVAAAMIWHCGDRDLYMYGATSDAGRRALAAYALQWECILAARRRGATRYDLGGVPLEPSRPDDPMHGPALFKKGFGGRYLRFAGAHDVAPGALAYRAYRTIAPIYTRALQLRGGPGQR